MAIFVERDGVEIELGSGSRVEKGEEIFMRNVIRERHFRLGESIQFNAAELMEAAYGCYAFGVDLVTKLPRRERRETAP
jgi:hypothetical protein